MTFEDELEVLKQIKKKQTQEYNKKYRKIYQEQLNKKYYCCCGGTYTYTNKVKHKNSQKHTKYNKLKIENKNV